MLPAMCKFLANAQEDILSITASLAGSGTVGVAGVASVIDIDNTTTASINSGATVNANGSIAVTSSDQTETDLIAGSVGIGLGGGGGGASVGVTTIAKDTQAFIGNDAVVDAKGNGLTPISVFNGELNNGVPEPELIHGVGVQAQSSEDVFAVAASGAGGTFVGIAGAVTVETIDSDTLAYIGDGAAINQDATDANALQSVNVSAFNDLKIFVVDGAIGGAAFGGISGGVDVGIIRNDTSAYIGSNAMVAAMSDVGVNALANKDINVVTVSAAIGAAGIGGGVAVYSLGGNLDDEYSTDSNGDGSIDNNDDSASGLSSGGDSTTGFADQQVADVFNGMDMGVVPLLGGFEQGPEFDPTAVDIVDGDAETIDLTTDPDFETGDAIVYRNGGGDSIGGLVDGQTYYVIVDEAEPNKVQLTASRSDALNGENIIDLDPATATGTTHRLDSLTAGGAQDTATSIDDSAPSDSAIDDAANESDPTAVSSGTSAFIGANATVSAGGNVDLDAREKIDLDITVGGIGLGGVGVGAGIGIVNINSDVQAYIGQDATIVAGDTVSLHADLFQQTTVVAFSGTASGLGAIAASISVVNDNSNVSAYIENGTDEQSGANVSGSGELQLNANSLVDLTSTTIQGNLSLGIALGGAVSIANNSGSTNAYIGDFTTVNQFGDVVVSANNTAEVDNLAVAVSAALTASGAAGVAIGTIDTETEAYIGAADVQVSGDVSVDATSQATIDIDADGGAVGAVAAGVMIGIGRVSTTTRAYVDDEAEVQGQNLNINANATNNVTSNTIVASGGILGVSVNQGKAIINGTVDAYIGENAEVITVNDINLSAVSEDTASADTIGVSVGAAAVGVSLAEANVNPNITSHIKANANLTSNNISINAEQRNSSATADAISGAGGIISFAGADADAIVNGISDAYLSTGVELNALGNVSVTSSADKDALATGGALTIGVIGVGFISTNTSTGGETKAYLDNVGTSNIGGNLLLDANANHETDARTTAAEGGILGGGVNSANALSAANVFAMLLGSDVI